MDERIDSPIDLTKANTSVVAPDKAGIGQAASIKVCQRNYVQVIGTGEASRIFDSSRLSLDPIPSSAGANLVPANSGHRITIGTNVFNEQTCTQR